MKQYLFILIAILSCNTINAKRANPMREFAGKYTIQSYLKTDKARKLSTFSSKKNEFEIGQSGDITLNIGCNTMNANLFVDYEKKASINNMITTEMFCNQKTQTIETRISELLLQTNKVENGKTTLTFFKDKKKLMVLSKIRKNSFSSAERSTTEQSLTGKFRILHQQENDVDVERMMQQSLLQFEEGEEKRFNANVGCNSMSGKVEHKKDGFFNIDAVMQTKMACNGDIGNFENELIKNLKKAKRFRTEANHLYIYDGEILLMMLERVN